MRRLGVLPQDVDELTKRINSRTDIEAIGIYTHYFKSDEPDNPEVQAQLELFNEVRKHFDPSLMTHTANTGAIFHYSHLDLQFDAVRPGVSLFGYGAGNTKIEDLKPAIEWETFLMQVKSIRKGEPVSYGGRWIAPEDGYLGMIPVGYSSGINRLLTNQIFYQIDGKHYPQVGTITMDYAMVYLGKEKLEAGTKVILLNTEELNAKDWADKASTIPYEITTGINPLIERVFV
jgi:alanine racemase